MMHKVEKLAVRLKISNTNINCIRKNTNNFTLLLYLSNKQINEVFIPLTKFSGSLVQNAIIDVLEINLNIYPQIIKQIFNLLFVQPCLFLNCLKRGLFFNLKSIHDILGS